MAKIQAEFTLTSKELTELNTSFLPSQVNPDTKLPFVDMNDYATWLISHSIKSYLESIPEVKAKAIKEAYANASEAVQTQVKTILGL